MMVKLRVLVAEDSATVRGRIVDVLAASDDIEVIGEAKNGLEAIEMTETERPDVITMDMMMPVMTGLAATEYIMAHRPTPILIVSASFNRGELYKIYDALAAGAVDVFEKPNGEEIEGEWERGLIAAVRMTARIKVITHPRGRFNAPAELGLVGAPKSVPTAQPGAMPEIVAIGASTGGPGAIHAVLSQLSPVCKTPILVVLHMNAPFGTAFTDWLDAQIDRSVVEAKDGMPVAELAGCVAVAPSDRHLVVSKGRMRLTMDAERHSCRPSVDVLFDSVAREYGPSAFGCLLTGMGKDGALGLLNIRRAGGVTIAQDEQTSVVYGMPREVAILGAAKHILPLDEIGQRISNLCSLRMEPVS